MTTIAEKVAYVQSQGQTRVHTCHWPGCTRQVRPAYWGCTRHWYALPQEIRDEIWRTYRIGQEKDATPSREYLEVARRAEEWIREHIAAARRKEQTAPRTLNLFD